MKFFNALDKASKTIKGDERKRLNKLLTGLNFTVLELQRSPLVRPDKELVATSLRTSEATATSPTWRSIAKPKAP